jgi:hypothetical protein
MNNIIKSTIALGVVSAAMISLNVQAQAEIHSKSKELVILEPHDLPEQAQSSGNSFFLHPGHVGNTYLYIE